MLVEERTTVGLDVHARSVVAEAVDWSSGETFSRWLTPIATTSCLRASSRPL